MSGSGLGIFELIWESKRVKVRVRARVRVRVSVSVGVRVVSVGGRLRASRFPD